jgi:hypothetical protein
MGTNRCRLPTRNVRCDREPFFRSEQNVICLEQVLHDSIVEEMIRTEIYNRPIGVRLCGSLDDMRHPRILQLPSQTLMGSESP